MAWTRRGWFWRQQAQFLQCSGCEWVCEGQKTLLYTDIEEVGGVYGDGRGHLMAQKLTVLTQLRTQSANAQMHSHTHAHTVKTKCTHQVIRKKGRDKGDKGLNVLPQRHSPVWETHAHTPSHTKAPKIEVQHVRASRGESLNSESVSAVHSFRWMRMKSVKSEGKNKSCPTRPQHVSTLPQWFSFSFQ